MSQAISCEEFVRSVSESGLLSEVEVRATIAELGGQAGMPDSGELVRGLVSAGRLTDFQAHAIENGRLPALSIGNYVVLDRLGSGGMGTVFKARHRRMKRVVALKLLSREAAGQGSFARRFQREVETIAKFNHPNIVMAFDADEAESGLFLAMELVDGRDLGKEVSEGGPLAVSDAVDCVLQTARGLAYAHDREVVHRDIKPANLLRDSSGVVKVADLGIARLCALDPDGPNDSLTQAGGVLGTADYMAPEQALDSATVDHRADVYSLGCTLFFLLTGRAPYAASSLMALLLKHRDAPIPALGDVRPDVPAELDRLCRRMMAKRPDDRHSTMSDVVGDLEHLRRSVALSDVRPARPPAQPSPRQGNLTVAIAPRADARQGELPGGIPPAAEKVAAASVELPDLVGLTVVLVEPSRAQARIVRDYLVQLGIENLLVAVSGREAVELARQNKAGAILCSMQLADMTGLELARSVHDEPSLCGVGFVLASSESDQGSAGGAFDAAPVVPLPKPFDVRGLALALARATGRLVEVASR